MTKEIQLKVAEAEQDDVGKGIVRIDSQLMKNLGIKAGDPVEITGDKTTVAIAGRCYPRDIGLKIIRMDGYTRWNSGSGIEGMVTVKRAKAQEAQKVVLAPADENQKIVLTAQTLKRNLLGRFVRKDDTITLGGTRSRRATFGDTSSFSDIFKIFEDEMINSFDLGFGFGNEIKLVVSNTSPKGNVLISDITNIEYSSTPITSKSKMPDITYEDIGGLKKEVNKVREMVELPMRHPEVFEKLGIQPPKGVLLYGPPGTGKTLLAKAVASESDAHFISINGPEIMSKWVGEAEKQLRKLFEDAEKKSPSIIFIDELDAIASKREDSSGEVERRVVAQMLALMDGLKSRGKVIVIAATNRPDSLDPALRRPGRFDREIEIGVPDKQGRLEILKIHTRSMPLEGDWHDDIAAKELLNNISQYNKDISEKIEKYNEKINLYKEDVGKLEKEIKELNEKKESADDSLVNKIVNKIVQVDKKIHSNNKKLNDFKEKISNMKSDNKKLNNIKEKLNSEKDLLDEVVKVTRDIERSKEIWKKDLDDSRKQFLEITKGKLSKEISEIIGELMHFKIIEPSFLASVRKKGLEKDLIRLANTTHGFVGADLEAVAKEAAMSVIRRLIPEIDWDKDDKISPEILEKMKVTMEDFNNGLKNVIPSAMREVLVQVPNVKWVDVGGLEEVKNNLIESVEWPIKHPESFKRLGIRAPRGILLYGPPGTGKTLLAKAVASESEMNFISVKGPELLSKWVGESEKAVRETFRKARQVSPCVVFFDEIDSLVPRRGRRSSSSGVTEQVVNQLLTEMDGLEELHDVIVIAATNRPDMIDPGLLRPGRIDRLILVPPPDERARHEIFKVHTKNMPLSKGVDLKKLSEELENYSGADIENICREAALIALRKDLKAKEITPEHFKKAIKKSKPSIDEQTINLYKEFVERRNEQPKEEIKKGLSYLG